MDAVKDAEYARFGGGDDLGGSRFVRRCGQHLDIDTQRFDRDMVTDVGAVPGPCAQRLSPGTRQAARRRWTTAWCNREWLPSGGILREFARFSGVQYQRAIAM
jgi:hypothetical protein